MSVSEIQMPGISEKELGLRAKPYGNDGMLEYWVSKAEKVVLSVQDRFAEARGKEFLGFSLKSAPGGRSSNLFQGNIHP